MTGWIRKATPLAAGCLLIGTAAMADEPGPNQSTLSCINLVGAHAGVVDPNAPVTMTIRDAVNQPVPNATVVINFSACINQDIRLGSSQPDPGTLVNCSAKTISRVTNGQGQVTFRIVGSANNVGNESGHNLPCASIHADGMPLGQVTVAAFDQNLTGSVTSSDLSKFASDFFGTDYRGRSDFNCSGTITSSELSRFSTVLFGNGSTEAITYCP